MKIEKVVNIISPKTIWHASVYAMLSFLTVFAGIFLYADRIYEKPMDYAEKLVGLTSFWAYPKAADLLVIRLALVGLILCYFLICGLHNAMQKSIRFPKGLGGMLAGGYLLVLITVFYGKGQAASLACVWAIAFVTAMITFFRNDASLKQYVKYLLVLFFATYGFIAFYTLVRLVTRMDAKADFLYQLGIAIAVLMVLAFILFDRKKEESKACRMLLQYLQLLIPFALLGSFRFVYQYGNDEVTLFASGRLKYGICILVIALFGTQAFLIWKKKEASMLVTVMTISMLRVFELPKALMNIDFFHNGEITVPMQQLVEYGKLPYLDLVPIHGFCDYSYGLLSYLFFDGSFLSLNAASVIMNMAMAAFLAFVIYMVMEKKELATLLIAFFVPFLVAAGMRYTFFFAMFLLLTSEKIRSNPVRFVWWYGFMGILAIAWNPSIGGSVAIAFFPLALIKLGKVIPAIWAAIRKKENPYEANGKELVLYGLLLLMGLAFIPLFLQIVLYLRENTQTTLIANGMGMVYNLSQLSDYFVPGIQTQAGNFFLRTFSCLIAMLVSLLAISLWNGREMKRKAVETFVSLMLCITVIASYAFVRYDEGLRTNVIGVFFLFVVGMFFANYVNQTKETMTVMAFAGLSLALSLCLSQTEFALTMQTPLAKGEVEESQMLELGGQEIEDPIVYVSGAELGMPLLGTGFISGNSLQSLKNIQYVLNAQLDADDSYLDLTNAVANYVIMNRKSSLKYTSGYNISNDLMQTSAIETLSKQAPKLVLLAPFIKFDDATISLRSEKLYRYLLEEGYKPYHYGNVIYLTKENHVPGSEADFEGFAQLMHKESLMFLPGVWGEGTVEETLTEKELNLTDCIEEEEGAQQLTLQFDSQLSGRDVSYIAIRLTDDERLSEEEKNERALARVKKIDQLRKGYQMAEKEETSEIELGDVEHITICFEANADGNLCEKHMSAYLYGDSYLFPVGTSPYWTESQIASLQITGKGINLSNAEIRFYQ